MTKNLLWMSLFTYPHFSYSLANRLQKKMRTVEEYLLDKKLVMGVPFQLLLHEAMRIERSKYLNAEPFERTTDRVGYSNGYKDKRVRTRLGELSLQVPQVRNLPEGESFYPSALEKGLRSERALKVAIAEMYVKLSLIHI